MPQNVLLLLAQTPRQLLDSSLEEKSAIYKAVENAEDSTTLGWEDLKKYHINEKDVVIGIAASGTTPYVVHALEKCQQNDIPTGCICCNPGAPLTQVSDHPIAVVVGPEFVTGSSRMKAGTAQKMILNMITTATMIRLGHVQGNKMVDLQLSNAKLRQRAVKIIQEKTGATAPKAQQLLDEFGGVRAIKAYKRNKHEKLNEWLFSFNSIVQGFTRKILIQIILVLS